jgi:hypothetical protein
VASPLGGAAKSEAEKQAEEEEAASLEEVSTPDE